MQSGRTDARASHRSPFGSLLRSFREAASLSQEELAERAGLTTHAISALERGARTRPYPHTIRALADALGVSDTDRAALIAAVPSRRRENGTSPSQTPVRVSAGRPPVPATSLVGRDADVARVAALLRDPAHRIVTLTGTGGVGKTRLSLAAVSAVEDGFVHGTAFVELAPLLDPHAVLPAIAEAVEAGAPDARDVEASLHATLHDKQVLVVLDNFEHLLPAATAVARLVERCPRVTVLVSSRAALRVRGEVEYVVQPLALPTGRQPDVAAIEASPAGALFLDRARTVNPALTLTADDAAAVSGICARLAGIPLALELAAARTRVLNPAALLSRLDEALSADGARDLPARQRTMTAALDWSYGLLDEGARALLRLLSAFSGGFTLEDVEGVAERAGTVPRDRLLTLFEGLVEQSLVVPVPGRGPRRHRLLEPVAQYARSRLDQEGETRAADTAHLEHFLNLAERAAPQYERVEQVEWLDRVDAEHANMSVAMERAVATGSYGSAARLGWALWLYWWLRGHVLHGRRSMEMVLEHELPDPLRAKAEIAAATMAFALDDVEASRAYWDSALRRARETGDVLSQANALAGVGLAALASGDLAAAAESLRGSVPLAEEAGAEGEWIAALVQVWLGTVALLESDTEAAVSSIERGLVSARGRGDRLAIYIALYNLSQVASAGGDHATARRHLEEGIRLSTQTRDLANLAHFLDALSVVAAAGGEHARVPLLLGAAQGIRTVIGTVGYGYYRPDPTLAEQAVAQARERLGSDRYDDALDTGLEMSVEEAVALALGETVDTA